MKFSDQIRKAIKQCGLTPYRLAAESGLAESTLSRFLSGEQNIKTDSLDKIAETLRFHLTSDGPRKAALLKPRRGSSS